MKLKIKEIVVVEGKDDVSAVKKAVDAEIIQTNGFAIRKKGAIEKLRVAYEKKGLIVLTDPDFVGEELRKYIQRYFPKVKHAYIGRKEGTKNGNIGVENANIETIIRALKNAKSEIELEKIPTFNMEILLEYNLVGHKNSKNLREQLGTRLGIGYSNAKQLLSKLNRYGIEFSDFKEALK